MCYFHRRSPVFVNDDNDAFDVLCAASTFPIVCRGKEKPITTLLPHNSHEANTNTNKNTNTDTNTNTNTNTNTTRRVNVE